MALYSDLELDPITNDLLIVDQDLRVIPDTTDAIVQRLRIRLKFFQEEWFLNRTFGIPYYQSLFVKGVTKAQVDALYRSEILDTQGVIEIVSFNSILDSTNREYSVGFSCRVSTGDTIALEV